MSLFDLFSTDDPKKAAYMAMAAGLLGNKGSFGSVLSQSMMGAQGAFQNTRKAQQEAQLNKAQIEDINRKAELARLPSQFLKPPSSPVIDATGGMDTAAENAANASGPGGFDMQGYINALMGKDPVQALQMQAATEKRQPELKEQDPTRNYGTWKDGVWTPVFTGKPKDDEFSAALRMAGVDPASPQGKKMAMDRVLRMASHPPAVQIGYQAPIAAINPATGQVELFRPDNKGGMTPTGIKPPSQDRDIRMTEAQAKAATFKSQMESAERELQSIPIDASKLSSQMDVKMAGGLTNILSSPVAQRARQAQEQWAESFLRFKTGAAATKDEVILNVRTFFPQPGDSPQVISQKKRARDQAVKDISFAAGQHKQGDKQDAGGWSITPKP